MSAPVLSSETPYDQARVVSRTREKRPDSALAELFHVDNIADHIISHDYKRPCLQFPDELVQDSTQLVMLVECRLRELGSSVRVYALADTSYSSCCVDEIAAQHVGADIIFHLGDACLNPVRELPVVYVLEDKRVDLDRLVDQIKQLGDDAIIYADIEYTACLEKLQEKLPKAHVLFPSTGTFIPDTHVVSSADGSSPFPHRLPSVDTAERSLIYMCSGHPSDSLILYLSTLVERLDVVDVSQLSLLEQRPALRKRYRNVQLAKSAGTIGILVNTLSLKNMLELLNKVKELITTHGKKYYTFVVGKPNVPKLANFEAIDIWVVLGCPLGGLIVDSQEFYRPVITVYELEMALSDTWDGRWLIDFEHAFHLTGEDATETNTKHDDEPYFDPVTGKLISSNTPLRQMSHLEIETDPGNSSLYETSQNLTVKNTVSTAAKFLQSKSWRGLGTEHDHSETFAKLKTGRSGIARDYNS